MSRRCRSPGVLILQGYIATDRATWSLVCVFNHSDISFGSAGDEVGSMYTTGFCALVMALVQTKPVQFRSNESLLMQDKQACDTTPRFLPERYPIHRAEMGPFRIADHHARVNQTLGTLSLYF